MQKSFSSPPFCFANSLPPMEYFLPLLLSSGSRASTSSLSTWFRACGIRRPSPSPNGCFSASSFVRCWSYTFSGGWRVGPIRIALVRGFKTSLLTWETPPSRLFPFCLVIWVGGSSSRRYFPRYFGFRNKPPDVGNPAITFIPGFISFFAWSTCLFTTESKKT